MLETDNILPGNMFSNNSDFSIIRVLDVLTMPRAPSIMVVPSPGWIRVNTGGSALGAPRPSGCGGVFCAYRGFVKGCFAYTLDNGFAFDAELYAFIIAFEREKRNLIRRIYGSNMILPWYSVFLSKERLQNNRRFETYY